VITNSIRDYHSETGRYIISVTKLSTVRSYIYDIQSKYGADIEYSEVTPSPTPELPNRLVVARVDNIPIMSATVFETEIKRRIETMVNRDNPCEVEFQIEFWVTAATEENKLSCLRYTQLFQLLIENSLSVPLQIKMLPVGSHPANNVYLNPGDRKVAVELRDLLPDAQVCDFRILAVDAGIPGP
jgi:hypothetical protein